MVVVVVVVRVRVRDKVRVRVRDRVRATFSPRSKSSEVAHRTALQVRSACKGLRFGLGRGLG